MDEMIFLLQKIASALREGLVARDSRP